MYARRPQPAPEWCLNLRSLNCRGQHRKQGPGVCDISGLQLIRLFRFRRVNDGTNRNSERAGGSRERAPSAGGSAFPQLVAWQHHLVAGRPVLLSGVAVAGTATDGLEPSAGHGADVGGHPAGGINAGRRGGD